MPALTRLYKTQSLPISLEMAWNFFSNPRNLPEITPPDLGFEVLSEAPSIIYPGLMLQYSVRPLFGIRSLWVTEITHVCAQKYFVDEQRIGPYRLWHHEHHFHSRGDACTEIEDVIHYGLPFGWLGSFFAGAIVSRQVENIFRHREKILQVRFGKG